MLARATWTTSTCERSGLEGVACRIESSGDVGVESISFDATSGDDVWPVVSTGGQAACVSGRGYLVSRQISGPDDKPAHYHCRSDSKRYPSMGVSIGGRGMGRIVWKYARYCAVSPLVAGRPVRAISPARAHPAYHGVTIVYHAIGTHLLSQQRHAL